MCDTVDIRVIRKVPMRRRGQRRSRKMRMETDIRLRLATMKSNAKKYGLLLNETELQDLRPGTMAGPIRGAVGGRVAIDGTVGSAANAVHGGNRNISHYEGELGW